MSQTKAQLIDAVDGSIVTADIADDAINADKLASNAVVNASVASNAAIAASKIADFVTGNTNNRVLTASGTANSLIGESGLLFTSDSNDHTLQLTGSGQAHLQLTSTSGSDHCSIDFGDSDDNDIGEIRYTNSTNNMHFDTNATLRMTLDSSGRLLLGTSDVGNSDADDLTIGNSSNAGITLRSGTSSQGAIYFSDGTSGAAQYDGYVAYSQNSRNMVFGTAQSTRMQINSAGQLLSGTTSSNSSDTNALFAGGGNAGTGNYGKIYLSAAETNPGPNTALSFIGTSTNNVSNNAMAFISVHSDGQHASNDYPTRFGFHTTLAGGSGATEKMRIHSGGTVNIPAGVTISAAITSTSSANTLDDYEEGTWSPGGSWDNTVGVYTKIGRVVHAAFRVRVNTTGSASMQITNLPYASANDEASRNGIFWGWNEWDSTVYGQLTGNINPGTTEMNLYRMDGSGTAVTYNQLGNDKELKGVCCYQTAT